LDTHRQTDNECFSELADVQTQKELIPPCFGCKRPSVGMVVDEVLSSPSARPTFVGRFWCHNCGHGTFAVMSYALRPHYEVIPMAEDRWRVTRLTREQAISRMRRR
jgi:hypothetical protein